jgi:hypothetical protein
MFGIYGTGIGKHWPLHLEITTLTPHLSVTYLYITLFYENEQVEKINHTNHIWEYFSYNIPKKCNLKIKLGFSRLTVNRRHKNKIVHKIWIETECTVHVL